MAGTTASLKVLPLGTYEKGMSWSCFSLVLVTNSIYTPMVLFPNVLVLVALTLATYVLAGGDSAEQELKTQGRADKGQGKLHLACFSSVLVTNSIFI